MAMIILYVIYSMSIDNKIMCLTWGIRARYCLAILGAMAMGIIYGLKVNFSEALVSMINHTAVDGPRNETEVHVEDGPFTWSKPLQGVLLSAYFWGYLIAQGPGGAVAEEYSAKYVMFFSVSINVLCTLLTPLFATIHYSLIIAVRIGEGFGGGTTFPAMHVMLSKWAPPTERSVMSSITYAGTALGTVISLLATGTLAANFGWESVFYVMGGVCALWLFFWVWLIHDSPQEQRIIGEDERQYIIHSLHTEEQKHYKIPWKAIAKSPPFWAILIAHTCSNWGWYMFLLELPFYMNEVMKFSLQTNAVLTALPFFTLWIFSLILSEILDFLRERELMSTTVARKIGTFFASVVPMLGLAALCYLDSNKTVAVTIMVISITGVGGMFSGFLSNHIDIAPPFAGILMAITNTAATIPGIVVPAFVGFVTKDKQTIKEWRIVFLVTIALYMVEVVVYMIFGSGNEQEWSINAEESKH